MDQAEKIIVALDTSLDQARVLAQKLKGKAQWLKVGMTLYYSAGPAIVAELKEMGFKVFVDLKLHDIPHQVQGAARAVASAGADMLTVHASGGTEMMQAACRGAEEGSAAWCGQQKGAEEALVTAQQEPVRPICLAITVLTSLDNTVLRSVGVQEPVETQVQSLAALAKAADMDGVVCSPREAAVLREAAGEDFVLVTPGVRPEGSAQGDQARVATPLSALEAGASYLVIGRPITEAQDAVEAFEAIAAEMRQ